MKQFRRIITLVIVLAAIFVGVLFALQNREPVALDLLVYTFSPRSLALWVLVAFALGGIAGIAVSSAILLRGRTVGIHGCGSFMANPDTSTEGLLRLIDYYADFGDLWLLALSGTLILALDVWITLEGLRMLIAERGRMQVGASGASAQRSVGSGMGRNSGWSDQASMKVISPWSLKTNSS